MTLSPRPNWILQKGMWLKRWMMLLLMPSDTPRRGGYMSHCNIQWPLSNNVLFFCTSSHSMTEVNAMWPFSQSDSGLFPLWLKQLDLFFFCVSPGSLVITQTHRICQSLPEIFNRIHLSPVGNPCTFIFQAFRLWSYARPPRESRRRRHDICPLFQRSK